jgi:uncharacterized glyoxalase superfamily protein PhnB
VRKPNQCARRRTGDETDAIFALRGQLCRGDDFYQRQLGGTLILTMLSDTPMKDQMPEICTIRWPTPNWKAVTLRSRRPWLHPTRVAKPGNTVALDVGAGTYGEGREIFDKLAENADADLLDDLLDVPFGTYGHLADQYGVHWFFQGEPRD